MNCSKLVICSVSLVFVMATMAAAQMQMREMPLPRGVFRPIVGQGSVYERASRSGPGQTVELDIVGKDSVNGKDAYWLEWIFSDQQMGNVIAKTEMVLDNGYTFNAKTIVQMAGAPPMEMPAAMMSGNQNKNQPADIRTFASDLGSESVTTPAGTFACEHWQMKDGSGDGWLSGQVTPFGLVKSVDKDGSTFVLVKVITGATDKVTGTPVPFDPMLFMGRGRQ